MKQPPSKRRAPPLTPADLERLAELVYRLMLAELRRERALAVTVRRKER